MSSEDLLVKLDDHLKATAQLHTVLHDHLKAHPDKLASCERLTKAHAATTDLFHHDAQVLVRPTGRP
jgi:hypothetical protein